ncbi:unnamed protein product [Blepharisma stoltei]|uniref:B box-type domain-containing protein n=1 Tax=Blepharisma stoltei TaxID=1481888 RepID=A0AAU9JWA2_9CILI|nr:unnamed protein product [Blepharisma stoltei]
MNCEECGLRKASAVCVECEQSLCPDCDEALHKGGKRKSHLRHQKCMLCKNLASIQCDTCTLMLCSSCSSPHMAHIYQPVSQSKGLEVLSSQYPQPKSNFPDFLAPSRILPPESKPRSVENVYEVKEIKKLQDSDIETKISAVDQISEYLKNEASKGFLLHEVPDLIQYLCAHLAVNSDSIIKWLRLAEKKKIIHFTVREFEDTSIEFVSLWLEQVTLEILLWTLRSLKNDEMMPTEKAIQCRMREVFDLKPTDSQWNQLIQKARNHSNSSFSEFSLFSQPSQVLPKFNIREISDPSTGSRTLVIYPNNEEWIGLDQHSKFGDYLNIKSTETWDEFYKFLEDYFTIRKPKRSRQADSLRAIPGGRYGCAQFIKLCGPRSVKNCSLGKVSYMVQLAINEDLLRYQRTLLVWTSNHQRTVSKGEIQRKMQAIEQAVLSILSKTPQGISLAQLPLYLKRALKFQLNIAELGFAKLKDLLLTFPRVTVELRGTNHPFAVLKDPKSDDSFDYHPSPDTILGYVYQIFRDNKFGISESKLEPLLYDKIGKSIDWSIYQTTSLADFIGIFAGSQFEVIRTKDTNMIFKIENPSYNYFYSPFRDNYSSVMMEKMQHSPHLHQTSYSLDFPDSKGKIVNISNIPLDFAKNEELTDEMYRYFDNFYDGSTDVSSAWNSLSMKNEKINCEKKSHLRTHSEGLNDVIEAKNPQHASWLSTSEIKPPPGFE